MEDWFEEFRTYLPKYLAPEASVALFQELKQFPKNIDGRMYTARLTGDPSIFQGDGLTDVWVSNLPDPQIRRANVMVLSNTCDVTPENKRLVGPRLIYCPIIKFTAYEGMIRGSGEKGADEHLAQVRGQRTSTMFYLPSSLGLEEESIALLDRITNCDLQQLSLETLVANRLFTLSDYGFYMFLFKLSIHLTRLREGVQRN